MTIRNCLAKIIPAPWFRWIGLACLWLVVCPAAPVPARVKRAAPLRSAQKQTTTTNDLAGRVRAWRSAPTPAKRAAVEAWAKAHPKDAALAQLALGIGAYEQKDFGAAVARLQKLAPKLPSIADYVDYYLAAARVEEGEFANAPRDAESVRTAQVVSPLAGKSWLVEARAMKESRAADAARLLRDQYAGLPQPEGDITLGDCYQAAGDLAQAAEFYQRVYYRFTSGDASARAAAALASLRTTMGAAYPQPPPQQLLARADRFFELHDYTHARSEYLAIMDRLTGLEREQARVRIGASDYLAGKEKIAAPFLKSLELSEPAADAERLYYLVECARTRKDDADMMAQVERLGEKHRESPWRLKGLYSAANRYLLIHEPERYVPLYKAVYQDFPNDPEAGTSHWKVTFAAYLRGDRDAGTLLYDHLRSFPSHPTAPAALYFLGRWAERERDFATARASYQRLATAFQNYYYGVLAAGRLREPELTAVAPSAKAAAFLAAVPLPAAAPLPAERTRATTLRIERSRVLRSAGLSDLADGELRFGARTDGQAPLLAMEMASAADAAHQAMRDMKSLAPDYLGLTIADAPRQFWELLFPMPYRSELTADAQRTGLDPWLVAGLIRQESEFNPDAVSHSNAYGLTQVRPLTGRQFARRAGVTRYSTRALFQPAVNLKIGTLILRSMLDQNSGRLEETLAAYNAGPAKAAEWIGWNHYREPAEFVESIPFTETREYVQAVIRNAGIYRRLYP